VVNTPWRREADREKLADQMGVNILGAPAHVLLLEATDELADRGSDFSLGLHGGLTSWDKSGRANSDSGLKTQLLVRQTR
jgi:hypothetical protein